MKRSYWWTACLALLVLLGTVVMSGVASARAPVAAEAGATLVGHLGGAVNGLFATSDHLFIGEGAEFEILTPDGATKLGGVMLPSVIVDIAVAGNQAFVSTSQGLSIVNIGNPQAPTVERSFAAP